MLFLTDINPEQWGAALDFRIPEPSLLENKLLLQLLRIPEMQLGMEIFMDYFEYFIQSFRFYKLFVYLLM